jgi:hypothetical protein
MQLNAEPAEERGRRGSSPWSEQFFDTVNSPKGIEGYAMQDLLEERTRGGQI